MKVEYWKQLQDPRWQERRLAVLNRAKFRCEECGEKPELEALEIHHRYYKKGMMAWEYPLGSLVCLCNGCHEAVAGYERMFLEAISPHDGYVLLDLAFAIDNAREYGISLQRCVEAINYLPFARKAMLEVGGIS